MIKRSLLTLLLILYFQIDLVAQEKLAFKGDIPRLAWYSVPAEEINIERYRELKESGITVTFSFFKNISEAIASLDMAQKVGLKVIVQCPELKNDPEKTVKRLMKHPALAGYFLLDEPSKAEFAELAEWAKRIQAIDNKHYCYLNLLPMYAEGWQFETRIQQDTLSTTYEDYLTTFIKEVPMPFISYDFYCIVGDQLRPDYFQNLEIMARETQKAGKDFWAFALTSGSSWPVNFPPPTLAELRFQMYSILAYGAQGVQYFTYWTPSPAENNFWDFHEGPIGLDGKRTVTYDRMKAMNEEVKSLSGVFYGSKVVSVSHVGKFTPIGTDRMVKLPPGILALETNDSGAVVSTLENEDNYFIVIVNRDFKQSMNLTIVGDKNLQKVLKDGSLIRADRYHPTLEVDPGDAAIYMITKANLKK